MVPALLGDDDDVVAKCDCAAKLRMDQPMWNFSEGAATRLRLKT